MLNIAEMLRAEHTRHAEAICALVAAEHARHEGAVRTIFALAADGTDSETSEEAKPQAPPAEPLAPPAVPKKPRRPRQQSAPFHPAEMVGTTKLYDGVEYRIIGYISEAASPVKCALFEVENVETGAATRLKSNLLL